MPPTVLPWISEADYPCFQSLIPELQAMTYLEWVDDHHKAVAYRRLRNGSVDVVVSAAEFTAWSKETHALIHLELLWVYAEEKVNWKPSSSEAGSRLPARSPVMGRLVIN